MGKGSKPRPFSVSQSEFAANFDRIFGKKDKNPGKQDHKKNAEKDKDKGIK